MVTSSRMPYFSAFVKSRQKCHIWRETVCLPCTEQSHKKPAPFWALPSHTHWLSFEWWGVKHVYRPSHFQSQGQGVIFKTSSSPPPPTPTQQKARQKAARQKDSAQSADSSAVFTLLPLQSVTIVYISLSPPSFSLIPCSVIFQANFMVLILGSLHPVIITICLVNYPACRGQILSPWLGDIVDSDIGFSFQPASIFSLAELYDNPVCWSQLYPSSQGLRICLQVSVKTALRSSSTPRELLYIGTLVQ